MAFMWQVQLNDDSIISEFDEQGNEHLFKEVLDRLSDVKILSLYWESKVASVDLTDGSFLINGEKISFNGISNRTEPYRLIYFKRVQKTFNIPEPNIKYYLGYQITIDGVNYQRLLQIDNISKQIEFVEKNVGALPL